MSSISASTTSTTGFKVTADTTGTLVLQTGATPTTAVTIDGSQNVGIGTTSPSGKFHTAFNATGNQFAYLTNNQDANTGLSMSTSTRTWWVFVGDSASNALRFYDSTAAAERMRIDSSGNLLVGTTSNSSGRRVNIESTSGGVGQLGLRDSASTAGKYWTIGPNSSNNLVVYNQGTTGVYITDGGTAWSGTSDERLKTDLQPIENGAAKVASLRAVTGRFKTDDEGVSRAFLIAQDVQAVLPEAVNVQDAETGILGLQYTDVIPLLVAAIKEQQALITQLQADVAALKGAA